MGIPSYFSYIIKNYSNIIRNLQFHSNNTNFEYLYMDCNSIVYDVYNSMPKDTTDTSAIETKIIDSVILKIDQYIKIIRPSRLVFIAFDGVAPFAKMDQQRTRRYKSWFMANINKTVQDKPLWNTSAITPGTQFMNTLSNRIHYAFDYSEAKYGLKKIVVSTSDEPGEGEHKMFEYIRNNKEEHNERNIAVYGLDSDLIMLSIFHKYLSKNIYICREAPQFVKSHIGIFNQTNDLLFMDIDLLSKSIITEMTCKFNQTNRIYDYIFMCFMLGNDFMPHFPALNIRTHGIQVLMETYRLHLGNYQMRYFISQEGKIQWKYVYLFITELAKMEHNMLLQEYNVRDKMDNYKFAQTTPQEKENMLLNTPIIYRGEEKYICPQEKNWEERYYMSLFECKRTPENIKIICNNYIQGLEWTYKYYTEGCYDWKWKYNYHYPPLLCDLVNYIPAFNMEIVPSTENKPFLSSTQLKYVLPTSNLDLLGKEQKIELMQKYRMFYPDNIEFQWTFCRYFWESHVILPEIPLEVLESWNNK